MHSMHSMTVDEAARRLCRAGVDEPGRRADRAAVRRGSAGQRLQRRRPGAAAAGALATAKPHPHTWILTLTLTSSSSYTCHDLDHTQTRHTPHSCDADAEPVVNVVPAVASQRQGEAPQVRSRVPPLVATSHYGPAVDLDALLLALLEDVVTGVRLALRKDPPQCSVTMRRLGNHHQIMLRVEACLA